MMAGYRLILIIQGLNFFFTNPDLGEITDVLYALGPTCMLVFCIVWCCQSLINRANIGKPIKRSNRVAGIGCPL